MADRRKALLQREEERRVDCQFLFLRQASAGQRAVSADRFVGIGLVELHRGMEGLQQRQAVARRR